MSYIRKPKTKHLKIEKSIVDPDALEYGVKPIVVGKVPDSWDDKAQPRNKGWKLQSKRKSQWRG